MEAPTAFAPVLLVAHARADGAVDIGSIRVSPDITGVAWQTVMRRALPSPAGVQVALLDGEGVYGHHDDPRRIGMRSERTGDVSADARVSADPDGDQRITAFAPLAIGSWSVVTERLWNPGLEAFRGIGIVMLPPLRAAARRLAAGDSCSFTVNARGGDEVGDLARQFESMASQL